MKLSEYSQLDAVALGELVGTRQVDSNEIARCAAEATFAVNPTVRAVLEVLSPPRRGSQPPAGPLAGVPFLVKDVGAGHAGVRSELGSRLGLGLTPDRTGEIITRFLGAGMQAVGRSAASEFALLTTTETQLHGATCTPWSAGHSAGGSSGGAAAAVSAGIVPVAHGNDGGGSIRIPAACCGVIGLKPSRGRVSNSPTTTDAAFGWVSEFAVTRSMRDTATLLDAVSGPASGDPYVIRAPTSGYVGCTERPPGRLRVGIWSRPWSGLPPLPDLTRAVERVGACLESAGCQVVEATPEFDWATFADVQLVLFSAIHRVSVDSVAKATGRDPTPEVLEPHSLAVYCAGRSVDVPRLMAANRQADALTRRIGEFFTRFDLLVTPTMPVRTDPLGSARSYRLDDGPDRIKAIWGRRGAYTDPFNMAGNPAISLPVGLASDGLPVGVQLVAPVGDEAALIRCGAHLEREEVLMVQTPPLHLTRLLA